LDIIPSAGEDEVGSTDEIEIIKYGGDEAGHAYRCLFLLCELSPPPSLSLSPPPSLPSSLTHLLLWLEVLRNFDRNDEQTLIVVTLVHMHRGDLASPHAELSRAG
jgi:hypothetical protein